MTDFGLSDIYVGVMKGVISSIAPGTEIIDITHQVEAGNFRQAAFLLKNSYKYFPDGNIFLCVVDSGVGTGRLPIVVKTKDYIFVAPNNGIISWCLDRSDILSVNVIENPEYLLSPVSRTFHGRDMFAPAAAHLAKGLDINDLGRAINQNILVYIDKPVVKWANNCLTGEIIHIDHFGNLISTIKYDDILNYIGSVKVTVEIGGKIITGLSETFQNVHEGEFVAYTGSNGELEIGINGGNAATEIKAKIRDKVLIY
jgi:S-adenosylmethionine hydrolase